jgi:hypothetical protein
MFCEDMPDHIQELLPHLKMKVLGKEDDRHVAHIKLETPMIMENRSFVCLTYQKSGEGNDDEYWFALSTRHNEKIEDRLHEWMIDDVIGTLEMVFHFAPDK